MFTGPVTRLEKDRRLDHQSQSVAFRNKGLETDWFLMAINLGIRYSSKQA
jgi:hypothetical protein